MECSSGQQIASRKSSSKNSSFDFSEGNSNSQSKKKNRKWLSLDSVKKLADWGGKSQSAEESRNGDDFVRAWLSEHGSEAGEPPFSSLDEPGPLGSKTLMEVYRDIAHMEVGSTDDLFDGEMASRVEAHTDSLHQSGDVAVNLSDTPAGIPYANITWEGVDDLPPEREEGKLHNTCIVKMGTGQIRAVAKCVWRPPDEQQMRLEDVVAGICLADTVHHPSIVPVLGWTQSSNDKAVWVMTQLESGLSIQSLMTQRHTSGGQPLWSSRPGLCVNWVQDVLDALSYLHGPRLNLVHGRLCVGNVLLSPDRSSALLTDCVFNSNFRQKRGLTCEHDIRSFGFLVWQLVCGKIICDSHTPLKEIVPKLYTTPEKVAPKKIGSKGMRALFKGCVHTEGSKHVAVRSMAELERLFIDLLRKGLLSTEVLAAAGPGASMASLPTPKSGRFSGLLGINSSKSGLSSRSFEGIDSDRSIPIRSRSESGEVGQLEQLQRRESGTSGSNGPGAKGLGLLRWGKGMLGWKSMGAGGVASAASRQPKEGVEPINFRRSCEEDPGSGRRLSRTLWEPPSVKINDRAATMPTGKALVQLLKAHSAER